MNDSRLKGARDRNMNKEMGVQVNPKERLVLVWEATPRLVTKTWQLMENSQFAIRCQGKSKNEKKERRAITPPYLA